MNLFGIGKRSPQDRIRSADNSTQRLRDKRSKLDPWDNKGKMKINKKIHKNNVEIGIAKMEMRQPKTEIKNTTNNVSLNKNDNSKQLHLHGHYHSHKDKSKK
jgi:hypothetical protein